MKKMKSLLVALFAAFTIILLAGCEAEKITGATDNAVTNEKSLMDQQKANTERNTWQPLGVPGFSLGSVNSTATVICGSSVFTAFSDAANNNRVSIMELKNNCWQYTPGGQAISQKTAMNVQMVAFAGYKIVAFIDQDIPSGIIDRLTVMISHDNGSWAYLGSRGFSPGQVMDYDLTVNSKGVVYVGFKDMMNAGGMTVMQKNIADNSDWSIVGGVNISQGCIFYPQVDFYQGRLVAVYSDFSNRNRAVMITFCNEWSKKIFISKDQAIGTQLKMPYVVFSDFTENNRGTLAEYSWKSWKTVKSGFTPNQSTCFSLDIYNKKPYIAFTNMDQESQYKANVVKFQGKKMLYVGSQNFTNGQALKLNLKIFKGKSILSFRDQSINNKISVVSNNYYYNAEAEKEELLSSEK